MVIEGLPGAGQQGEQTFDLDHGEWDRRQVLGWWLARAGRCWRWSVAGSGVGGGDRADRQGGHDQHDVSHDRRVEADLGGVEAELVLAELVVFLDGPAPSGHGNQHAERGGRWSGTKQWK